MEYVQGKTLGSRKAGQALEVADAMRYIKGILPAFSYLAKLGLVYCDFKPQNVMLETLKDGAQVVRLIDMGTVIKYVPNPKMSTARTAFMLPKLFGSIEDNINCLSNINKEHLDAAYEDTTGFFER